MNFTTLLVTISGQIARVTINRPDALNSLNAVCKRELADLFGRLRADHEVRAVIITGAGEKSFVAGTDISELTELDAISGREFAAGGQAIFDTIQHLGKPVIAAVNGYALGGGCELALACHIRIATPNAKFGQPEVHLGIIPGYGGTQRLARTVGIGKATEMILTGSHINADEAYRIGLVNAVVPREELLPAAETMAKTILAQGPLAVRMALEALNASMEMPLPEGLKVEASLFGDCCATDDCREGTTAFLDKRKPVFTGK